MLCPWLGFPNVRTLAKVFIAGTVFSDASCLPDAIPASNRVNLTNSAGQSYPLGISFGATFQPVPQSTSAILWILLEEIYGYNLVGSNLLAGSEAAAALAGCTDPANLLGCDEEHPRFHIALAVVIDMALYLPILKSRAPKGLPMGLQAFSTIWMPGAVQDAALADGTSLGWYQNWNASWHDPAKYFDSFTSIPTSELTLCQDSWIGNAGIMTQYVAISGDNEGLHPNKTGRCLDGFWFITPACRSNHSRCVPMMTAKQPRAVLQTLQKAAAYSMPFAVNQHMVDTPGITLPLSYSIAYFRLSPGETILLPLRPVPIEFPPYDELAWSQKDYRTMFRSGDVHQTFISWNLVQLAPRIAKLMDQLRFPNSLVDELLSSQASTGDDWKDVACRWMLSNRDVWLGWIPDETVCLPSFGLYSSNASQYVSSRTQKLDLSCLPCASGRFSEEIFDSAGVTYICSPCSAGTYQAYGAARRCELCPAGEYQDQLEGNSCKRCGIGFYQDQLGSTECKECSEGTKTVGRGALSQLECGCREGYIETARDASTAVPVCDVCQNGMTCPIFSTEGSLRTGNSDLGEDFLPQLQEGFMSLPEAPLSVFKCNSDVHCPGGPPGTCGGGRISIACSTCRPDEYWKDDECQTCPAWVRAAWILVLCVGLAFVPFSRFAELKISSPTGSTLAFTILCIVEIGLNLLQSMGIVHQMQSNWPDSLAWSFSFLDVFAFNIHELGFTCLVGTDPLVQYALQVGFVPVMLTWVSCVHMCLSVMCVQCRKLQRLAVKGPHLLLIVGQVVMMCFEALSNMSLVPWMCYRHPNGSHSNLQFASILCSSDEHIAMTCCSLVLGVLVLAFLSLCGWVLLKLPRWSLEGREYPIIASQFLTDQFRADAWWFGLAVLFRGPVLSLLIAVFTDEPHVQIILIAMAMISYLVVLLLVWPFKLPLLNALESACIWSILILVLCGSLYIPASDSESTDFSSISTLLALAFAVLFLGASLFAAFAAGLAFSLRRRERRYAFINLGMLPDHEALTRLLLLMADKITAIDSGILEERLAALSPFDSRLVLSCITMLSLEILPLESESKWLKHNRRVLSRSSSILRSVGSGSHSELVSPAQQLEDAHESEAGSRAASEATVEQCF